MAFLPVPVHGRQLSGFAQPGSVKTVLDMGGTGLRLAGSRLGQAPSEDWFTRARRAVLAYDKQIQDAALIADDSARGRILMWVGRADVPGSPAERYSAVVRDITQAETQAAAGVYGQIGQDRVQQLEAANIELASKVSGAIEAYGALPASSGAGGRSEAGGNSTLCIVGGIALLTLVVLPLLLD